MTQCAKRILVTSYLLLMLARLASAQASQPPQGARVTQEVVVTATATPISVESLGRAVTVFTAADLERLGISSIVEALRLAPGVDPRARGSRDGQTDFSIRGATFGQSLILVDGTRLNDSQSGHHNGDIPMALAGLDRIEIVNGVGSAVHGADALGGTINVISRHDRHALASIAGGQFGYAAAQGSASGVLVPRQWTLTGWGSRSTGFTVDRDFVMGGAALRGALAPGWTLDVRRQDKAFGANGFYGASPSKEWTDQTLVSAAQHRVSGPWMTNVRATWRNHGDHFRWDINRPGFAENRHRTNAGEATMTLARELGEGRRLTLGGAAGGDWVRSTNLGNHDYTRGSGYAELQVPLASRTTLQTGVRLDGYSTFGTSWSPTASISSWATPQLRLRASVGHAFRIPTFTELYYHDPANQGSADLRAERGWSIDGGADWTTRGWTVFASPFTRWDKDVIDWLRATSADLWRSTNVRDVTTTGVELGASRRWRTALFRGSYSGQAVHAPSLALLSKYVLEYARHSVGLSIATPIAARINVGLNVDHRRRLDGQNYSLVGLRVSRPAGRADVFFDAANLLNANYHEVAGVAMPGRWITIGLSLH
jgi:outer membrane cobalamin receptor